MDDYWVMKEDRRFIKYHRICRWNVVAVAICQCIWREYQNQKYHWLSHCGCHFLGSANWACLQRPTVEERSLLVFKDYRRHEIRHTYTWPVTSATLCLAGKKTRNTGKNGIGVRPKQRCRVSAERDWEQRRASAEKEKFLIGWWRVGPNHHTKCSLVDWIASG